MLENSDLCGNRRFRCRRRKFWGFSLKYTQILHVFCTDFYLFGAKSPKFSPVAAKSPISVYFQVVLLISEFLRELIFCMNFYLYFRVFFEFLREQTLFISEFLYYSRRAAVTSKPKLVPHMYDSQCFTSVGTRR